MIVGAGFSGIGAAIRLRQEGIEDFVVLERADEVGGTWEANTYPGCRCDVPSHLYSYSFAPNPDWSEMYSPQAEIWQYLIDTTDRFGIRPKIRFGWTLATAEWDEERGLWRLRSDEGEEITARVVISAVGGLVDPRYPDIPGIESFEGEAMHSARWNHDYDVTGKRVAVIGTGASGIQIVPEIAPKVAHLHVFQRTAAWVMPHRNRPITRFERRLFRRFPALQRLRRGLIYASHEPLAIGMTLRPRLLNVLKRVGLKHLEKQVPDPELRRKLTPTFVPGCKRLLPTNDFYPALMRDNVELVTDPIAAVTPKGIRTADGTEHELDAIVFATGYEVHDRQGPEGVRGRDGHSIREVWEQGGTRAHRGTTIAGFPNHFTLLGPNTGGGHQSIVYMIESQINYVLSALRLMERRGLESVEVRPEAHGRLQPRDPAAQPGHRLADRGLRELVPRRTRPQRHDLAQLHLHLSQGDPRDRPRRVHPAPGAATAARAGRPRTAGREHRVSAREHARDRHGSDAGGGSAEPRGFRYAPRARIAAITPTRPTMMPPPTPSITRRSSTISPRSSSRTAPISLRTAPISPCSPWRTAPTSPRSSCLSIPISPRSSENPPCISARTEAKPCCISAR